MCACGVDIGTCFLVSARQDDNAQVKIKSIRDAFLDMDNEDSSVKNMLKMSKVDFIEEGDKIYLIGDHAVSMANLFKREVRRPLSRGVLSPGEIEAEKILLILLQNILGKAKIEGETCFYSVPGAPIDRDMDVIYHQAMFSKLLSSPSLSYRPIALNEAAAISYSNAAKENFSSLSISFGAGAVNLALMYQTMIGMAFSLSRGGDWVDQNSATVLGKTSSHLQAIKERGIDLMDPTDGDAKNLREREAIIIYYKSLILYAFDSICKEFQKRRGTIDLPYSIPIILSGGTTLAKNFLSFFKAAFETVKNFPIPVSEIRMATDPLNAVSQGLLVAAMNYDEGSRQE